ncbi:uncharacterized protein LOC110263883 [Arachis ipaensis]|uniref:uncharacterized protein LOC110263883 n=1 Tax=Arachis ipaensis TaxID=130454 RepID=UPI000A2B7761|nr:uncharacterized protein LOC110263883 [Arachis ipaensis]
MTCCNGRKIRLLFWSIWVRFLIVDVVLCLRFLTIFCFPCFSGGKYPGVSAASLMSRVKSKGLDKEVSSSKAEKVGVGEVDQPRRGRRKVIAKKRKGDVVDLSDVSGDEKDDVPMEELHRFCENQKKLHGFIERSEGSSLWGKYHPFMITVDEVCQTPSDVSLAEEVGDVAIDQYMQVVGLRLASLGCSREKIHRKMVEKREDPSLKEELAVKVAKVSELEVKLFEVEKHLKEVKESYAKDVEDLKKKEADLSSLSTRMIEVTAQMKELEKNKQGEILDSFLEGFERAVLQARFLAPEVDLSAMDPGKIVQDGVLVEDDGAAEQGDENV